MTSSALRCRKRTAAFAAIGSVAVVVAALGAGWSRGKAADKGPNPFADRFPNLVLKTHEGKSVRFYDDLLKGKIVLINFMYATCKGR